MRVYEISDEEEALLLEISEFNARVNADRKVLTDRLNQVRWRRFGAPYNVGDHVRSVRYGRVFIVDAIECDEFHATVFLFHIRKDGSTSAVPTVIDNYRSVEKVKP